MKKYLSLVLAALVLFTLCFSVVDTQKVSAASNIAAGTCGDNLDWWLTTDGVLHIEGTGEMDNWSYWSSGGPPWKNHPEEIKEVIIGEGVTSVGTRSFSGGCKNLKSVTLPSTLTLIGYDAFRECSALSSINLPNSIITIRDYAFAETPSLRNVTLPSNLKVLGMCAFEESGLTSIVVPPSLTTFDAFVFRNCDNMVTAKIGVGTGSYGFETGTFECCDNLTTVVMGNAITYLGSDCFYECPKLKNVTIGKNVTSIRSAFAKCTALEEIVIPDKVEILDWGSFGFYATFTDCTNLKKIVLGESLKNVNDRVFEGCTSIEEVYFFGDCPSFGTTENFKGCTVTAYYPKYNDTWKPNKMTNQGGYVDWIAFDPVPYKTVAINAIKNSASSGKNVISWDAMKGAAKYQIYRATSKNGKYSYLGAVTKTSATDVYAKPGVAYYYKVRAISQDGNKSKVSAAAARTCDCARPVVSITLKSGDPKISWKKITGAKNYQVYRSTSKSSGYSRIKTVTGTSFTDTSAKAGKTYYYRVKAISSATSAADSAASTAKGIKAK